MGTALASSYCFYKELKINKVVWGREQVMCELDLVEVTGAHEDLKQVVSQFNVCHIHVLSMK